MHKVRISTETENVLKKTKMELKNTITELNNSLEGFNNRLAQAEKRISKLPRQIHKKDELLNPFCFILKGLIEYTHNVLSQIYICQICIEGLH